MIEAYRSAGTTVPATAAVGEEERLSPLHRSSSSRPLEQAIDCGTWRAGTNYHQPICVEEAPFSGTEKHS